MRLLLSLLLLAGCPDSPGDGGGGDGGTRSSPCFSGSPRAGATAIVSGLDGPFGVAADAAAVYWTETGANAVKRANKDGSGVMVLANEPGGVPEDLTADSGWLYYMAYDQVKRVDKAASAASSIVASGYDTIHSHGLVADGSAVYFAAIDKSTGLDVVVRVDPDGGNKQVLAMPGKNIFGLTMDAGWLYFNTFASPDPPTQYRVAKSGGMTETLQSGAGCWTSACDGKSLYCGDSIGPYRLAVAGGKPVVLCTLDPAVLLRGMLQIGDKLYVLASPPSAAGAILEVDTRGTGRVLSTGVGEPRGMATDGSALFYSETSAGKIMKVVP